jgi:hypothetical protein
MSCPACLHPFDDHIHRAWPAHSGYDAWTQVTCVARTAPGVADCRCHHAPPTRPAPVTASGYPVRRRSTEGRDP